MRNKCKWCGRPCRKDYCSDECGREWRASVLNPWHHCLYHHGHRIGVVLKLPGPYNGAR